MNKLSRRDLLKGLAASGVAPSVIAPALGFSSQASAQQQCSNLIPFEKMSHAQPQLSGGGSSLNGEPVLTQANPGNLSAFASEHRIDARFWSCAMFTGATNGTRHLLTIDVGANPASGSFHPMVAGATVGNGVSLPSINTISDIYVFDATSGSLLYWRQLSGSNDQPSAMIVLNPADVTAQRSLRIVARCSLHGLWAQDIQLTNPQNYSTAIPAYDAAAIFGGTSFRRPYSPASAATAGGQNLGDLHRTRFTIESNRITIGIGNNHPHEAGHYIMGGALYDQNGNLLAPMETILFSEGAGVVSVSFNGLNSQILQAKGVRTLRGVMFDCLQGLVMSVFEVA